MQAKQRSDARGPAAGLRRGGRQNGQQVVANIRKNSATRSRIVPDQAKAFRLRLALLPRGTNRTMVVLLSNIRRPRYRQNSMDFVQSANIELRGTDAFSRYIISPSIYCARIVWGMMPKQAGKKRF
jgi:hypothetical protein